MVYVIGLIVLGLIVWGILHAITDDRYANMTSEEFEEEAKQHSSIAGALGAFQKIVDPNHKVEYVEEQQERMEAEDSDSGDRPHPPAAPPSPREP